MAFLFKVGIIIISILQKIKSEYQGDTIICWQSQEQRSQGSNRGVSDSTVHCFTARRRKLLSSSCWLSSLNKTASSSSMVNPQPPKHPCIYEDKLDSCSLGQKQKPREQIVSFPKLSETLTFVWLLNYCASLWLDLQTSWRQGPHCSLLIAVTLALGRCGA